MCDRGWQHILISQAQSFGKPAQVLINMHNCVSYLAELLPDYILELHAGHNLNKHIPPVCDYSG